MSIYFHPFLNNIIIKNIFLKEFDKHFKDTFIKISFGKVGREYIFNGNEPKFLLYWTRSPARVAFWPRSGLAMEDISALSVLDTLPKGIPSLDILNTYWCEDPTGTMFGTFFFFARLPCLNDC